MGSKKQAAPKGKKVAATKSVADRKAQFRAQVEAAKKLVAGGKRPETIGEFIEGQILLGKLTPAEIAAAAKKAFKGETTVACVYWYRQHLKNGGVKLPA